VIRRSSSSDLSEVAALLGAWPHTEAPWAGAGVVPFGENVLHSPTQQVEAFTDDLTTVSDYMIEVMHEREGVGLAANQIGLPLRMFVHNMPRVAPPVIVNPRIIDTSGTWEYSEGCLSMTIDGTHAPLVRPKHLVVECVDLRGRPMRIEADEWLSRVFQHEIDHLDGVVYAERLVSTHRSRVFKLMNAAGTPTDLLDDLTCLSASRRKCDVGRSDVRQARSPVQNNSGPRHAGPVEMFVVGIVLGLMVLFADPRRPAKVRQRSMSEAQALGYRAAFGEDRLTMQTRRDLAGR